MATMAHHLLAKTTTDEILNNFKTGSWTYGASGHGTNFLRTGTPADFPSPDAAFYDSVYGDNVFEKHGINRDRTGDGEKPRCLCGKRGIFNRDGAANYQTT